MTMREILALLIHHQIANGGQIEYDTPELT